MSADEAVRKMQEQYRKEHAPTPKTIEVQKRHADSTMAKRKPGPIWCKYGKRRVKSDDLRRFPVMYNGVTVVCPECGGEVRLFFGNPYVMAYAYGSHPRGDRHVDDNGRIVRDYPEVSRETEKSSAEATDPQF